MSENLPSTELGFQADAVDVLSKENPRSVINLVPRKVAEEIEKLPTKYILMSEDVARKRFHPTPVMNQLRSSFWYQYNLTQTRQLPRIVMENVFAGICSKQFFHEKVLKSQEFLSWMVLPPQDYSLVLNEGWDAGFFRVREMLDLPLHDKKGKFCISTANLIFKIWQSLDQRKYGTVAAKNLNVNLTGKEAQEVAVALETKSIGAIQRRIKDLAEKNDDHKED